MRVKIAGAIFSCVLLGGVLSPHAVAEVDDAGSGPETDYVGYESGVLREVREGNKNLPFRWLSVGKKVQHPHGGGKWEYGFWLDHVRSNFNHPSKCHGSTVVLNGNRVRSVDTAAGHVSVAAKWAYNLPNSRDEYYYRFC